MTYPDPLRSSHLGNGYAAVVCVTPAGDTVLWLLAHSGDIQVDDDYGCNCPNCAPHEHPGRPIPPQMQTRLDRPTQPRCGRPRADGQPCQTPVARPGLTCHWHRTTEESNR